uniref:F-box domain-containing protein n=1 Tax=Pseudo-nitzschia australis TaxID=44445 RepID=A0A7S4EEQ0_9STRA
MDITTKAFDELLSELIPEVEAEANHLVGAPTIGTATASDPLDAIDSLDWSLLSSEETQLVPSDRTSCHFRNESNPINAVHMHVQDNARIPNYNYPVDRSNSNSISNKTLSSRNKTYTSDALLASNREPKNSMAEIFLNEESRYRKSLSQSYEVMDDAIFTEIEELAAVSANPTPWLDNITYTNLEETKMPAISTLPTPAPEPEAYMKVPALAPEFVAPCHPHQSSYYPYGRHHQLPIPERSSPPPRVKKEIDPSFSKNTAGQRSEVMAEAVAIAAEIVRTTNNDVPSVVQTASPKVPAPTKGNIAATEGVEEPPSTNLSMPIVKKKESASIPHTSTTAGQPNRNHPLIAKTNDPAIKPSTTTQLKSISKNGGIGLTFTNGQLLRQRANAKPPPHAAAHTVRRASLLAATNRKSQYGFGGNHTIPSVPAPPTIRSVSKSRTSHTPKQITTTKKPSGVTTSSAFKPEFPVRISFPPVLPSGGHLTLPIVNNTGSAYERKKQKAKNARVKLNESIESLSVAVSLAGSQSRSRIDQLENEVTTTECRQKSIQVNQEGIRLAENAKKWDRPSFVGTAASVIISLNAQCEALMAELIATQKLLNAARNSNGDNSRDMDSKNQSEGSVGVHGSTIDPTPTNANAEGKNSNTERTETVASHQNHKRQKQPVDLVRDNLSPNKRPRVDSKMVQALAHAHAQNSLSRDEIIYGEVAKMLDPVSLCRCMSVCKLWKETKAFQDDGVWLNLAVNRFGFYNVRQWNENLKDEDDEEQKISNKYLFKKMNAHNVMPHYSQDGLSLLGNGKITGKISGWAFLVERSNGETLRSVKRDPRSGASGGGGYQSKPVVQLRILVQNTGMASQPVILKSQNIGVDVSTRRRGGEFEEISWDDRFKKIVWNMDGTIRLPRRSSNKGFQEDLCFLELFEAVVLEVNINARSCSTISKFQDRSNFTKVLVSLDGTTVPMVIPFLKHK